MQTAKTYWAQVEGVPDDDALAQLRAGWIWATLSPSPPRCGASTRPAWVRARPIRVRQSVPDSWLEIIIHEGKNRQVRRMTARWATPRCAWCARHRPLVFGRLAAGRAAPADRQRAASCQWRQTSAP